MHDLFKAIEQNDSGGVKSALADNKPPNAVYRGLFDALSYACYSGSPEIVKLLLDRGANSNFMVQPGTSIYPLHVAGLKGDLKIIKMLVEARANVIMPPPFISPITAAVFSNSTECVKFLLEKGANPNVAALGIAPLMIALLRGNLPISESLIKAGADLNAPTQNGSPLIFAINSKKPEVVEFVIKKGAEVNPATENSSFPIVSPLNHACFKLESEIVEVLIANGAHLKTDHTGSFPLHTTLIGEMNRSFSNDFQMVTTENVVQQYEDTVIKNILSLTSIAHPDVQLEKNLVDALKDLIGRQTWRDETNLDFRSIGEERAEKIIELLIPKSDSLLIANEAGYKPIELSRKIPNQNIYLQISSKLEKEGKLDFENKIIQTIIERDFRKVLEFNSLSDDKLSLIFIVGCILESEELIDFGLQGGNINAQDKYGLTGLHYLFFHQNESLIEKLKLKEADDSLKDENQQIPENMAKYHDFVSLLDLIRDGITIDETLYSLVKSFSNVKAQILKYSDFKTFCNLNALKIPDIPSIHLWGPDDEDFLSKWVLQTFDLETHNKLAPYFLFFTSLNINHKGGSLDDITENLDMSKVILKSGDKINYSLQTGRNPTKSGNLNQGRVHEIETKHDPEDIPGQTELNTWTVDMIQPNFRRIGRQVNLYAYGGRHDRNWPRDSEPGTSLVTWTENNKITIRRYNKFQSIYTTCFPSVTIANLKTFANPMPGYTEFDLKIKYEGEDQPNIKPNDKRVFDRSKSDIIIKLSYKGGLKCVGTNNMNSYYAYQVGISIEDPRFFIFPLLEPMSSTAYNRLTGYVLVHKLKQRLQDQMATMDRIKEYNIATAIHYLSEKLKVRHEGVVEAERNQIIEFISDIEMENLYRVLARLLMVDELDLDELRGNVAKILGREGLSQEGRDELSEMLSNIDSLEIGVIRTLLNNHIDGYLKKLAQLKGKYAVVLNELALFQDIDKLQFIKLNSP